MYMYASTKYGHQFSKSKVQLKKSDIFQLQRGFIIENNIAQRKEDKTARKTMSMDENVC